MNQPTLSAERKALLAKLLKEKAQTYHFPLSYGQQGLWVIYNQDPSNTAYNMAWAVTVEGALLVETLRAALAALVVRHPALRTTLEQVDGEARQCVQPQGDYHWTLHETGDEAALWEALRASYRRPFDITRDAVLRVDLARVSPTRHLLLLTMHHIFGDAESLDLLGAELFEVYRARCQGESPRLAPLNSTYADFVRAEAAMVEGVEGERMRAYWLARLGGEVPTLRLPLDHPRPAQPSYKGGAFSFTLPTSLSCRLKVMAKEENSTLFTLFLSALQILLQRYSGESEVWIGSPSSVNRHHPKYADIVGYLANSVVLRGTPGDGREAGFIDLVRENRPRVLEAIQHATYPFPLLVKSLLHKREAGLSPLFQVMLDYKGADFLALAGQGGDALRLTRVDFAQMEGQFDLTLNIIEGEAFLCTLYYVEALFERDTIEQMAHHLERLLSAAVEAPHLPHAELPWIEAHERAQLDAWGEAAFDSDWISELPLADEVPGLTTILEVGGTGRVVLLDPVGRLLPQGVSGEVHLDHPMLPRLLEAYPDLAASYLHEVTLEGAVTRLVRSGRRARWGHDGRLQFVAEPVEAATAVVAGQEGAPNYLNPRDDIEFRLARLWEALLDHAPVSVVDDFFAIGGDSLLAIRLLFNIQKEFALEVPMHALFEHKRLEQLAALIRKGGKHSYRPLVCLDARGEKRPVFFVHASGGTAFDYLEIANLMGGERPFYAFQPRGIEMGDAFHDSIEQMAIDYVAAVREVQPHGPYLLGGWSFGATVAFEMARLLENSGERVIELLMIDTPAPTADVCKQDDFEFLMDRLPHYHGVSLDQLDLQDDTEKKVAYLLQEVKLSGLFTPDIDQAYAHHWFRMYKHHNATVADYHPAHSVAAPIDFLKPSESIPFDEQMGNPSHVWARYTRGEYRVLDAPGNHFTMVSPVNNPALAQMVKESLARAEAHRS